MTDYVAEAQRQLGERRAGWAPLLAQLLADIAEIDPTLHLSAGTKFGRLRVFAPCDCANPAVHALIWEAEEASSTVCEQCGQPGKTLWCFTWVTTLCPQHAFTHRSGRRPADHWPAHADLHGQQCPDCGYVEETDC